jgi:hypothetical protein
MNTDHFLEMVKKYTDVCLIKSNGLSVIVLNSKKAQHSWTFLTV